MILECWAIDKHGAPVLRGEGSRRVTGGRKGQPKWVDDLLLSRARGKRASKQMDRASLDWLPF
jgi:hypothetical protein